MLGLPKSTEMSKQLPKKAVYAKFQMNTAAKEKIDADISRITIVNEITPAKINIPAGEEVGSFFVLLVALKKKDFDERTVATLSKLIPQNILFVLEFEGQSKLAIYHTKLMQTNWKPTESCTIEPRGLNLDKVWENIVVDIGGHGKHTAKENTVHLAPPKAMTYADAEHHRRDQTKLFILSHLFPVTIFYLQKERINT